MTKLTPAMEHMIRLSWDGAPRSHGDGYGVELRGQGAWTVARLLVASDFGHIEGGRPNGSDLPGLFFATRDAADFIGLFDDDDDGDEWWEE